MKIGQLVALIEQKYVFQNLSTKKRKLKTLHASLIEKLKHDNLQAYHAYKVALLIDIIYLIYKSFIDQVLMKL